MKSDDSIRGISEELVRLVDSMEVELRDTGSIRPEDAKRLGELRVRLEQLLERGAG